ncbi:MAG: hypothetical protein DRN96_06315 [Thermoproteota archaeon]|nr:MAG: hypothetical protein DRN96_06315 [Candidatus Korarchaeota archaeon]RLG55415.1 MAG: hypothetical protein DRN99_02725 [Candidatus Korarchaeota archaeon]
MAAALAAAALALSQRGGIDILLAAWTLFCLAPAILILPPGKLLAGLTLSTIVFLLVGIVSHSIAAIMSFSSLILLKVLPIGGKTEPKGGLSAARRLLRAGLALAPRRGEGEVLQQVPSISQLTLRWKPSLSIVGESRVHAIKLLEYLILPLTGGLRQPMVVFDVTGKLSGLAAVKQAAGRVKVIDGRQIDFTYYEPLDKVGFIQLLSSLLGDVDVGAARVAVEDGLAAFLEASSRESTLKSIAEVQSRLGYSPLEDLLDLSKVNVIDLSAVIDPKLRGAFQRLIDLQLYRLTKMGLSAPVAQPLDLLSQRADEVLKGTLMEVLSRIEEEAGLVIALSAYSDFEFTSLTRDLLISVRSVPRSLSRMLDSLREGLSKELARLPAWEALYVAREPSGLQAYKVSLTSADLSLVPQPAVHAQPARVKAVVGALRSLGRKELEAALRLISRAKEAPIPEHEAKAVAQVRKPMRLLNLLVELGILDWDLVFTERGEPKAVFKSTPLAEAVLRELLPEEPYSL